MYLAMSIKLLVLVTVIPRILCVDFLIVPTREEKRKEKRYLYLWIPRLLVNEHTPLWKVEEPLRIPQDEKSGVNQTNQDNENSYFPERNSCKHACVDIHWLNDCARYGGRVVGGGGANYLH